MIEQFSRSDWRSDSSVTTVAVFCVIGPGPKGIRNMCARCRRWTCSKAVCLCHGVHRWSGQVGKQSDSRSKFHECLILCQLRTQAWLKNRCRCWLVGSLSQCTTSKTKCENELTHIRSKAWSLRHCFAIPDACPVGCCTLAAVRPGFVTFDAPQSACRATFASMPRIHHLLRIMLFGMLKSTLAAK
jgi:hypothetical protein